jgi:hypothetical protein
MEDAFCPRCGQKDIDLERPILELLREVLEETFEVDGRAARTLRALLLRPGELTFEYLQGHRRRYTPPVRLYLIVSVSFFLLATWLASRGLLLEQGQELSADAPQQARFLGDQLPKLMFVLLPVFALLLKLGYRQRLYFDHLIFSLHFHSTAYIAMAVMLPLEDVSGRHWLPLVAQLLAGIYLLAYFVIALRRVYDSGWLGASLKMVALLLAYMVILSGVIESTSSFLIIAD